jgi:predicted Zn-dependent protease
VFGGRYAAQAASEVGQVAGAGLIAAYSRDQERQADRVGQDMAARAGWDPAAMSSFLRTLDRHTRLDRPAGRRPSFLDSHPMTPERVDATAAFAQTLPRRGGTASALDRAGFLAKLEGLVVGDDPAGGVLDGDRFLHPELDFHLRLPADWRVENSRTGLGALAPRGDALVTLELQGERTDPAAAARAFFQANRLRPAEERPLQVGDLAAYRAVAAATMGGGRVVLHLTWIAHRERVFRLTGIAAPGAYEARAPRFDETARSFGPLSAKERKSIHVRRLHTATARGAETLAELGARAGNTWSVAETAVVNGMAGSTGTTEPAGGAPLVAGQLLKVAVAEPYARRD